MLFFCFFPKGYEYLVRVVMADESLEAVSGKISMILVGNNNGEEFDFNQ